MPESERCRQDAIWQMMVENGCINVNKLTISGENVRRENTEYQLSLKETLKDRQWVRGEIERFKWWKRETDGESDRQKEREMGRHREWQSDGQKERLTKKTRKGRWGRERDRREMDKWIERSIDLTIIQFVYSSIYQSVILSIWIPSIALFINRTAVLSICLSLNWLLLDDRAIER